MAFSGAIGTTTRWCRGEIVDGGWLEIGASVGEYSGFDLDGCASRDGDTTWMLLVAFGDSDCGGDMVDFERKGHRKRVLEKKYVRCRQLGERDSFGGI